MGIFDTDHQRTLADEIRLIGEQIRRAAERPSDPEPQPPPRDWSGTAKRIQEDIDQLMRMYGCGREPQPEPEPEPPEDSERAERLKRILKLVVAEL